MAIARALACEPEVLLLDEPFGALDVQTKEDMQLLIRQVWRDTGTTVLMVTHDVEEAVFLGQRVIVLASDPGRIAADMPVDLPGDRDLRVKRTPEFLALRSSIEDQVRAYHRRHTNSPPRWRRTAAALANVDHSLAGRSGTIRCGAIAPNIPDQRRGVVGLRLRDRPRPGRSCRSRSVPSLSSTS